MFFGLLRMTSQVFTREITFRQLYYYLKMRVFNSQKHLNDDFDWTYYHQYYREELKSVSRVATLLPNRGDFEFSEGLLHQTNKSINPLHPNHHLLYEIILKLNPRSVLEAGFGGGDHLRNLHFFNSKINLFGVDRSEGQMATLKRRHPQLIAQLEIMDLTDDKSVLPSVDLVYSQAVLMHISETQGRFSIALNNILQAAQSYVVMVENWTEHDFLAHLEDAVALNPAWAGSKFYYVYRPESPDERALILSKVLLPFEELHGYEDLLQGREIKIH